MRIKNDKLEELYDIQKNISSLISTYEGERYRPITTYTRNKAELITCKEAAKLYPIGEQKFRQLCRSKNKNFPAINIGSRFYIVKNKLDEWFIENAIGGSF